MLRVTLEDVAPDPTLRGTDSPKKQTQSTSVIIHEHKAMYLQHSQEQSQQSHGKPTLLAGEGAAQP